MNCVFCKKEINEKATVCPHCTKKQYKRCGCGTAMVGMVGLFATAGISNEAALIPVAFGLISLYGMYLFSRPRRIKN